MGGDTDWMADAACRDADPDMFFPESEDTPPEATAMCRRCEVSGACLAYALAEGSDLYGVWAGTSKRQRDRMRRRARINTHKEAVGW